MWYGGVRKCGGGGNMVNCPTVVFFSFFILLQMNFFKNLIYTVLLPKWTLMAQVPVVASMDIT